METVENKNKTVYVGMSGGVDSSLSASLLKERGYNVVGVFIDIWQPEFIECTSADDKRDAMRVCSHIGIPFKTFEAGEEYREKVVDYMVQEYRAGRTPNPDIMCNRYIKFGLFYKWAVKNGADLVATGHYARVGEREDDTGEFQLLKGTDPNKDQSYFLWAVSSDVFSRVIFPIGDMQKDKVRELAEDRELPTAKKKDSQGVCFLGKVDIKTFLSRYIPPKKGDVLNEKGEVIGFHDGAWFYTIGQRHGFSVEKKKNDDGPFYVIEKNVSENTLVVSKSPKEHSAKKVKLCKENWIPEKAFFEHHGDDVFCMTRYRQKLQDCNFFSAESGTEVHFSEPQYGLASGQSLVIYKGERCLGGGIIASIKH
ncbi:MAG: tRNA 2-thiouridine(34) synthase MnmA [Patescibacteria group bacterium]